MTTPSSPSDNWAELPLSEAVQINPSIGLKRGEVYPFVDMASVDGIQRTVNAMEEREFKGSGSKFQHGDTLMARITPCLENGKIAQYKALQDQQQAYGSTEFIVLRGRLDTTTDDFVYYLTRWEEVRQYAIGQMTGTSGRQRVPVDSLDHLTVPVPPIPVQRRIADILGALDDKIDLNLRMNETLEQMARALYKSWFVDFDPVRAKMDGSWQSGQSLPGLPAELYYLFPDRLVASELGKMPEGWGVGKIGDVASQRRQQVRPDQIDGETAYIGLEHIPRGSIALSEWGKAEGLASGKFRFKEGDILFGKLRPYFHKVGVAPLDGICSTDIVVVSPILADWFGFTLGHLSSTEFVDYTDAASTGTRMPRTNWDDMALYKVPLPTQREAKAYTELIQPWVDKIVFSVQESRSLVAIRNALLPELVSGTLRVGERAQRNAPE